MAARFYVETLGCPKNAVDSDKVVASLLADGLDCRADAPGDADLVVVNTCAFIEAARQESIDVALALADAQAARRPARASPGCMAERYGDELAAALPEADAVVGLRRRGLRWSRSCSAAASRTGVRDLLELPRPAPSAPWAYVKVAEGCDRACAFCAIPSFRGKQRSRTPESIEAEVRVARRRRRRRDRARRAGPRLVRPRRRRARLARAAAPPARPARGRRPRARPAALPLPERGQATRSSSTMLELPTVVPYFDLSLQHAAPGAAAAHEALGERRPLPRRSSRRSARRSPTPRSGRRSSSASRARPRTTTTRCSRSSRRRARLGRLLPVLARGRHAGGDARRRGRRRARGRAAARVRRACRTRSRRRARDALVGDDGRGPRRRRRRRDRRARRPHPPRGTRDRRRRAHRRRRVRAGPGALVTARGHRRGRARPRSPRRVLASVAAP